MVTFNWSFPARKVKGRENPSTGGAALQDLGMNIGKCYVDSIYTTKHEDIGNKSPQAC